jgi:hypothetical protein
MFRPSKAKLYERIIGEKDMHIRILVAEIDWLRAQLGRPSLPATISGPLPDGLPAELGSDKWESEADEAQKTIEAEGLSAVHLPEILDGLGYGNSDLG